MDFRFPKSIFKTGIAAAILIGLVTVSLGGGLWIWADAPWPTPNPAPIIPPSAPIPVAQIVPAPVPPIPGAAAIVVQPVPASSLPRVPPLVSQAFISGESSVEEQIKVHIEAGSILRTLQVVYVPVAKGDAPGIGGGREVLRLFELRVLDHKARIIAPQLQRPWKVEIPVPDGASASVDPTRLLLARYLEDEGSWMPLVTSYFPTRNLLMAKILDAGLFAVITDPPPYGL